MRSNCWLFTRRCQRDRGGFIVLAPSRFGWWCHRYWTADFRTFVAFETTSARLLLRYTRRRWRPPLLFPGQIVHYTQQQGELIIMGKHDKHNADVTARIAAHTSAREAVKDLVKALCADARTLVNEGASKEQMLASIDKAEASADAAADAVVANTGHK